METELEKDLISLYSKRSRYPSSLQTNYFKTRLIPFISTKKIRLCEARLLRSKMEL